MREVVPNVYKSFNSWVSHDKYFSTLFNVIVTVKLPLTSGCCKSYLSKTIFFLIRLSIPVSLANSFVIWIKKFFRTSDYLVRSGNLQDLFRCEMNESLESNSALHEKNLIFNCLNVSE